MRVFVGFLRYFEGCGWGCLFSYSPILVFPVWAEEVR